MKWKQTNVMTLKFPETIFFSIKQWKQNRKTYHWFVSSASGRSHRLRCPTSRARFRCIFRWIPVNTSVSIITIFQNTIIKKMKCEQLKLLDLRRCRFVYRQIFCQRCQWTIQITSKYFSGTCRLWYHLLLSTTCGKNISLLNGSTSWRSRFQYITQCIETCMIRCVFVWCVQLSRNKVRTFLAMWWRVSQSFVFSFVHNFIGVVDSTRPS